MLSAQLLRAYACIAVVYNENGSGKVGHGAADFC